MKKRILFFFGCLAVSVSVAGERLYNAIVLPDQWPPDRADAAAVGRVPYLEKDGIPGRFGHDEAAHKLGVEIMDLLDQLNKAHIAPYCECTDNHFVLHAQVGIESDQNCSPGTRVPIGEEPDELIDHLQVINLFHKYFPSGTGDIFPVDLTVHKNPQFVLDIIRGAMMTDFCYANSASLSNFGTLARTLLTAPDPNYMSHYDSIKGTVTEQLATMIDKAKNA
jgi:hypothetical protein